MNTRTQLNKRTIIMKSVNEQAEDFYDKSQELGTLAAQSFFNTSRDDSEKHRSQMTGLENIAETTLKATDVLDYIKKQIARSLRLREPDGWTVRQFGEKLKDYIENGLTPAIAIICDDLDINDKTEEGRRDRQHIRLELIRQLIRQVVVQYEYELEKMS